MEDLCRRYQESIGEPALPEELVRHGALCDACQEFRRRQEALQSTLPVWEVPEVSGDFTLTVMARVAEEVGRRPSLIDRLKQVFRIRLAVPLPVSAVAVVLLVCSVALNLFFLGRNRPAQETQGSGPLFTRTEFPTPAVVHTTAGSLSVPPEWLGTGPFLLVPVGIPRGGPYGIPVIEGKNNPKEDFSKNEI